MTRTDAELGALVCAGTGQRFALETPSWRDPTLTGAGAYDDPRGLLDIAWESRFPLQEIAKRPPGMWRYREAIPVPVVGEHDELRVSMGEGFTPLVCERVPGCDRPVLLKLDTLFPTGSYKDRGASVLVSHCLRLARAGAIGGVVEDSSGNAGASIAAYCARAGIACEIFVPASASPGKLVQVRATGATLVGVPGTRDDTSRAVWEAAQRSYYASHTWNPFFLHGTKTFAFEVCEQLGWKAPDSVVIPTGNGTLLLGCAIGFEELRRAGVIARVPRLIAVQSEACAPLADALRTGAAAPAPITAKPTLAEGIAIARPIRGWQILRALRETGGRVITVREEQIATSLREAWGKGWCIEPTCAAAFAAAGALTEADGLCVLALTGHGLKAPATIAKVLGVQGADAGKAGSAG